MTCVIGMIDKENKKGYIAADTFGSNDFSGQNYVNNKIFKSIDSPDILIGVSGSFRIMELLEFNSIFPEDIFLKKTPITRQLLVNRVIPKIKKLLEDNKAASYKDLGEDNFSSNILIVTKDSVFTIQANYAVLETSLPYASIGSGKNFALGSLYSTTDSNIEDQIKIALKSAEKFQLRVKGPFKILNTENDEIITFD